MEQSELNEKLEKHNRWLNGDSDGECADLRRAYLRHADLSGADLSGADLRYANLSDANLSGANMDYSCLPLWCGGLKMHIDDKIAIQILYHLLSSVSYSRHVSPDIKKMLLTSAIVDLANIFHRIDECEKLEAYKSDEN